MGIKGLAKLLSDEAPDSIREVELKSLHGRKIAVDASMAIYQFLIAVRSGGGGGGYGAATMLTNEDGETTSHIQGMFNRTIRFMSEGLKPVFIFDGKPPNIKSGELMKRRERREKAEEALKAASEEGNVEEQDKQSKRLVRAGRKENDDCVKLLTLMGVPVVKAPCEAEAQAAALAKAGQVYAAATEDMDALTFQTPILVRKMTFANASKSVVQTMNYQKALDGLELNHDQFVDLCILLGCDYCDSIRGVGPKTALKLIKQYGCIEKILDNIDKTKYKVPQEWIPNEKSEKDKDHDDSDSDNNNDDDNDNEKENKEENEQKDDDKNDEKEERIPIYVKARELFNHHEVHDKDSIELKWKPCQVEELTKFLVDDCGFNADRVKSSIDKLQKAFKANSKPQSRMDSFFKVKPNPNAAKIAAKRKAEKQKQTAANKKKKTSSFRRR